MNRFEEKYIPEPNSGCWLWIGALDKKGYGRFGWNKRNAKASRVSYELYRGKIPQGLQIDHLCRNRACVNPFHLEAVTSAENTRRGLAGAHNKSKTHCANGHPFSADNTRMQGRKRVCRECVRVWSAQWKARQCKTR